MNIENKKKFSIAITKRFLKAIDMTIADREGGKETASSIAAVIGMHQNNIARLRRTNGEFTVTLEALARLCDAYGINPTWLITGKGTMKTNDETLSVFEMLEKRIADLEVAGKKAIQQSEKIDSQIKKSARSVNKNVNTTGRKAKKAK